MVSRAGLEVLSGQLLLPSASFSQFGAKEDIGYTIREYVVLRGRDHIRWRLCLGVSVFAKECRVPPSACLFLLF